jgi:hypothetical protein
MKASEKNIFKYFVFQPACREQAGMHGSQRNCDLLSVILMAKPLSPPSVRVHLATADFFGRLATLESGADVC